MRLNMTIRVLHIISSLGRGGRERQLSVLAHYNISNCEQYIISFYDTKNSYAEEYRLPNLIFLPKNKISRIFEIYNFAKYNKINLIYAWGNIEFVYVTLIAKLLKIKLINGSIRHGIRLNKFSHRFRSLVLKFSKYIIGNSQAGFEANKINFNPKRHFVLYNGIEGKFFIDENIDKRIEFLRSKELDTNSTIFISIANFIPYKDYFTTLESLVILKSEGISFHYIMIGKGKMEEDIRNKIKNYGLYENITIFNNNPNIPELLSMADIMIHSSLGEGCSNAILEAKAAGLRVVASNTGGTKEIIGDEDFLFEFKNITDLTTKLKHAVKALEENLFSKSEIQINTKEKFSVKKMQQNYIQILKTILNDSDNLISNKKNLIKPKPKNFKK